MRKRGVAPRRGHDFGLILHGRQRYRQRSDGLDVGAKVLGKPDDDLEASVTLEHKPGALTAHRDFDQVGSVVDGPCVRQGPSNFVELVATRCATVRLFSPISSMAVPSTTPLPLSVAAPLETIQSGYTQGRLT